MSQQVNDTIDDYLKSLRRRVEELESALRKIAEHPHCTTDNPHDEGTSARLYQTGVQDGHRCAAEIARKALESK